MGNLFHNLGDWYTNASLYFSMLGLGTDNFCEEA